MPQSAPTEMVVVSYVDPDGFPRACVAESAQPEGSAQVVLRVPDIRESGLWPAGRPCPVGLLYLDPRRPELARQRSGVGRLSAAGNLRIILDGTPGEPADRRRAATRRAACPAPSHPPASGPPAAGNGAVLEIAGLSIFYGAKQAVRDLSLDVQRGEIFGLLGPNGAGKTSTLSAVEGLRKAAAGEIRLDGVDVRRHPIEAKAKMGVQLQATSFPSSLNLKQILRLFAGLYGVRTSDADLERLVAEVGLQAEATKPFKQLSGGQQQRLSLQVAVIHRPVLLLLDEPTAGLDPQARRQLWRRIEDLRRQGGSILLTTHSMEEAQAVCDRVAIMDRGEILACGPPAELIARHRNDPRVRALAHGEVTLDDVFVGLTGSAVRD